MEDNSPIIDPLKNGNTPAEVTGQFSLPLAISAKHLSSLDGFRGLAILLVLLFHMTVMIPSARIDYLWVDVTSQGSEGVDIFFVLSGYLITGILLDSRKSKTYFRSFYARRILRIFPLYYAVVAFSFLVLPKLSIAKSAKFASVDRDAIWYWLHLSNFAIGRRGKFVHGILDVSWSLAIEEQFYLLWPAAILCLNRNRLMGVACCLVLSAPLCRFLMYVNHASPIAIYTMTFCRTDGLALGALVAMSVRNANMYLTTKVASAGLVCSSFAAIVIVYAGLHSEILLQTVFESTAVCFGAASTMYLLVTASPSGKLTSIFNSGLLRSLGIFSYALYLFHFPLMAMIRDAALKPARFLRLFGSVLPGQLLFYIVAGGISLFAAVASWHLYEKQFLKLKKFFPMDRTG